MLRLRVARNKRTGASKHYAFVEFADADVARIVRETMDGYLIDGRLMQVRDVPAEKVHPTLWVGAGKTWRKVPKDRVARMQHDKVSCKVSCDFSCVEVEKADCFALLFSSIVAKGR